MRTLLLASYVCCALTLKTSVLRSSRLFGTMDVSSLLTCQQNAYLKESRNRVVFCEKLDDRFRILLQDSVLYPEGGGQPHDLGFVNGIPVLKVNKPTAIPPHLQDLKNLVEVELATEIDSGSEAHCTVDWARRYEFMQQHTAQHLFSAVADLMFGADTVGWAMGTESATVDLVRSPALTLDELHEIEDEVNARIRRGSAVNWKVFAKEALLAAADHPELKHLRGEVKGAALDMPDLRMVSIEDLDVNPCGGTHVQSLSELNCFHILAVEKDRQAQRIRFLAGTRALKYVRHSLAREAALAVKLSAPPNAHIELIDKLQREKRDLGKRMEVITEELATLWGQSLAGQGRAVVVQHRSGADLKFLLKAASTAVELQPSLLILLSGDEGMPVLPSQQTNPSASNKPLAGPIVFFGEAQRVRQLQPQVLALLGAKGGGKPGRLQGQATALQHMKDVLQLLEANAPN